VATKVKRESELTELRERFKELLAAKDEWRVRQDEARELPHAGQVAGVLGICDAAPGKCRRCVEFPAAVRGYVDAIRALNRASAQLTAYSEELRSQRARELTVARARKGVSSRTKTIAAVLSAFGNRSELSLSRLLRRLKLTLAITERQIRRQLKHPDLRAALEKAGKKIV
jgi:hypothetical protein